MGAQFEPRPRFALDEIAASRNSRSRCYYCYSFSAAPVVARSASVSRMTPERLVYPYLYKEEPALFVSAQSFDAVRMWRVSHCYTYRHVNYNCFRTHDIILFILCAHFNDKGSFSFRYFLNKVV